MVYLLGTASAIEQEHKSNSTGAITAYWLFKEHRHLLLHAKRLTPQTSDIIETRILHHEKHKLT